MADTQNQPIHSEPAVPLNELPAYCVAAFKRGQKVYAYKCGNCGGLRQFDVDRQAGYRKLVAVCECRHRQAVHLFS